MPKKEKSIKEKKHDEKMLSIYRNVRVLTLDSLVKTLAILRKRIKAEKDFKRLTSAYKDLKELQRGLSFLEKSLSLLEKDLKEIEKDT